jgi:hypothetical protein
MFLVGVYAELSLEIYAPLNTRLFSIEKKVLHNNTVRLALLQRKSKLCKSAKVPTIPVVIEMITGNTFLFV